jgi:hypothetical protein
VELWFDKPGSRKRTLKQPSDELIGRALIFDPSIAEHLKRMRLSAIREDSVVKQQDQGEALFEETIGADRKAWQDAREAVLLWLRNLYGGVERSSD